MGDSRRAERRRIEEAFERAVDRTLAEMMRGAAIRDAARAATNGKRSICSSRNSSIGSPRPGAATARPRPVDGR